MEINREETSVQFLVDGYVIGVLYINGTEYSLKTAMLSVPTIGTAYVHTFTAPDVNTAIRNALYILQTDLEDTLKRATEALRAFNKQYR